MNEIALYVIISIAWLSPDGKLVAHNSGVATDVTQCARIAEKNIADEMAAHRKELEGAKPIFSCWDTRDSTSGKTPEESAVKPRPGEQEL